jgi:hypothetical protein
MALTAAQLTVLRDALYTTYLAWIQAGCPQAYTLPGGKSLTKVSGEFFQKQINSLDAQITALTRGSFYEAQFRHPE